MLRRNFFSFLLAPLAFFKREEPLNEKNLEIDEDDMLIKFCGCNFIGNPPLPYKTWLEWSNSPTIQDVNIISNRSFNRPTLTKREPKIRDNPNSFYWKDHWHSYECSKHGEVHSVSFYGHNETYCTECLVESLKLLPIARLETMPKHTQN